MKTYESREKEEQKGRDLKKKKKSEVIGLHATEVKKINK